MKKLLAVCAAFIISASCGIFAMGVGPQLNTDPVIVPGDGSGVSYGVGCSAKFDSLPIYWALSTNFGNGVFLNGELTGDYWMKHAKIQGLWSWYWGLGAAVSTQFSADNFTIAAGPRGVVGMNWIFCDGFLELYAQGVVQPEFAITFGDDDGVSLPIYLPFNSGLRFWF
jgi:hypothetical protein